MKKRLMGSVLLILLLSISLYGCASSGNGSKVSNGGQKQEERPQTDNSEQKVMQLVTDFGRNLLKVSLQEPEDLVKVSLQKNYGDFISQTLLTKWQNDPQNAPGRLVSSPWPDRIEILSIKKVSESSYEVKGEIIEVTSDNQNAAKRPITLVVKLSNNHWLIDDVTIGAYEEADSIVYNNTQYGFHFSLPHSWNNFKIVDEKWEGLALSGSKGEKVVETGPMILIRHPEWTSQNQRQDIPIMIFTLTQWESLQNEEFHIGAAPVGPSELGRNSKYIFALPARYNFAFPTGYEEVETILKTNPLQPTEDIE